MSVATPVVQTWDGYNRRIILKQGVETFHWIDDIYAEYINERRVNEAFRVWAPFLKADGNAPKGGGKFTPRYVTLLEGTRVVPFDENILLTVTGEAITDNADIDPDPFDTTTRTLPLKLYITPPSAEIVRDVKSLEAISHMEFNNMVYYDVLNGFAGTNLTPLGGQIGTQRYPSNNLADTKAICAYRGFDRIRVKGNITVGATESVSGLALIGDGPENTNIVFTSGCTTSKATFEDASISGRQSGETHYYRCDIGYLTNVHCVFFQCRLIGPMEMHQSYGDTTVFFQCYTGDISGAETIIDLNNSPVNMSFNDLNGKLKFMNMNKATAGIVTVNMNAGKITIDSSCTTGTIKVRGSGEVINNSLTTVVDDDVTVSLIKLAIQPQLDIIDTIPAQGTLTAAQTAMLTEIFALMGLDPTKPLVVQQTQRTAGPGIVQAIDVNDTTQVTTVTRQ